MSGKSYDNKIQNRTEEYYEEFFRQNKEQAYRVLSELENFIKYYKINNKAKIEEGDIWQY